VLTNAGGPGILAADRAETAGLQMASLTQTTREALRAFLPPTASLVNPVDMIATATADAYGRALAVLLADPGVDSVLTIFIPPLVTDADAVAAAIRDAVAASPLKPVVATFMSSRGAPAALAGIPSYAFPESAVVALARLTQYGAWRRRPVHETTELDKAGRDRARSVVDRVLRRGGGWLTAIEAATLLDVAGIPIAATRWCDSAQAAVDAARELGYPVALKVVGPDILHKTEVGGVSLDIRTEAALRERFRDLSDRLGGRMTGVLVQEMVEGHVEALLGIADDPSFGPVVMAGAGGTLVELMAEVAVRLPPLTPTDVDEMLHEVPWFRVMRGFRGAAPVDEGAYKAALRGLAALAAACPEIVEADLNPVKVIERGVKVVDARIRVGRRRRSRHRIVYA
jgi:acyl-CoA synthetase (NDP forming)